MTITVHGIVRGKTIELDQDLGFAEGQQVEVKVRIVSAGATWGDGIRRSAGALADEWTDEDDRVFDEIHRARSIERRQQFDE